MESGTFPDKILTALEGSKAGDHKEIEVSIEDDDYYFEEFAGMTLVYKIDIQEVYIEKHPEKYTDVMAQEIGFKDLAAVKEKIKETIQRYSEGIYKRAFLKEYYRQVASRVGFMPSARMLEVKRAECEDKIEEHKSERRREKLTSLVTDMAMTDEILADIVPLMIADVEEYIPSVEEIQEVYNSKPDILWEMKSREEILRDSLLELESDWLFNKASQEFVTVKTNYVDKEPEFNELSLLL